MTQQTDFSRSGPVPKRTAVIREARELLANDKAKEALDTLKSMIASRKPDPEGLFLAAVAHERLSQYGKARMLAKKSLDLHDHVDSRILYARMLRIAGQTDEAVEQCEVILKRQPNHLGATIVKAGALEEGGRFAEATAVLQPVVDGLRSSGEPLPVGVRLEWSKLLVQNKLLEEAIEVIDETLQDSNLPDALRCPQFHLKAKSCDRKKDFDGAWEAAERANEIGRLEFDPELYEAQVSALIEIWSAENMAKFPLAECEDVTPVFVAGMPRSGTSLIDQIVDAHPKASGVGELSSIENFAYQLSEAYDPEKKPPACFGKYDRFRWTRAAKEYVKQVVELAPEGSERVVNKALGNNKLVGLIARLFPKTKVIHAIRDPRDVAISCFMGGFNNRLHPWTTRVEWAATAWAQSSRMMQHWKDTLELPDPDGPHQNQTLIHI